MASVYYVGGRSKQGVTVTREREDGGGGPLPMRLDLAMKSPTGFEWGYSGSGPAQFALAILSDVVGGRRAVPNFQRFKFAVVGRLPHAGWVLTRDEVIDWFEREAEPEEPDEFEHEQQTEIVGGA